MVEEKQDGPRAGQRQASEAERARGELSDYFAFEDMGPPGIAYEPRGGTVSREPSPPLWRTHVMSDEPGKVSVWRCDPVLMAVVYRRLSHAQVAFAASGPNRRGWRDIFAVLRARYGTITPKEEHALMVNAQQAKQPSFAARIDHAERLYCEAREVYPRPSRETHEQTRRDWQEARAFGVPLSQWMSDDGD